MERLWERKWTERAIRADAKRHRTLQEWSRSSPGAYQAAIAKGLLAAATAHIDKRPKWFPVAAIHRILRAHGVEYVTEKTFPDCRDRRKLPFDFFLPAYNLLIEHHGSQHLRGWQGSGAAEIQRRDRIKREYAERNGFAYLVINEWETSEAPDVEAIVLTKLRALDPSARLIKRRLTSPELVEISARHHFDLPTLKRLAREYETRAAFKRGDLSAYTFACRRGLVDAVCGHMVSKGEAQSRALTKWTRDRVIASAKKFRTAREWAVHEGSAYNAARKSGWLAEASRHFPTQRAARTVRYSATG